MNTILIVDDEVQQRKLVKSILTEEGFDVMDAENVDDALRHISSRAPSVILTDMKMPVKSGLDLIGSIDFTSPHHPEIIVMTAFATVETAVRAMKAGAYDYCTKPVDHDELILTVKRAHEKFRLRQSVEQLGNHLQQQATSSIIAESTAMRSVLDLAARAAASDATVLILGESGTGKERIAQYLHYHSSRRHLPMQCLNCAALPEHLLESELFGYERGAFTGAAARKTGILEAAAGSTVFLDEIADMSLTLQAKLLRVLQEKEIRRVGATESTTVDIRFFAATNRNLKECVRNGTFREDLFYRLNVLPIVLPPLRDRPADIPPLVNHFLSRRAGRKTFSPAALEQLMTYRWPGNVRELEAIIERLIILCPHDEITENDLPAEVLERSGASPRNPVLPQDGIVFEQWEQSLLEQALKKSNGILADAAKLLGMTYRTFQYRAEKFGLTREPGNESAPNG